MSDELRKWTLFVHKDDPGGVILAVERGHDSEVPEGWEAVRVIEVPYCAACGSEIVENGHTCSALLQPDLASDATALQ